MTVRPRPGRCVCGEFHSGDRGVTAATMTRMRAYLTAHPGHQFAVDDDTGIIAVIVTPLPGTSGPLRVIARSTDLADLLDAIA